MSKSRRKVTSKQQRGAVKGKTKNVKPVKPAVYKVVETENPRYEGTRAFKSYAAMLKVAKSKGYKFTLDDCKAKKVDYNSIDAAWDLEREHIRKVG